MKTYMRNGKKVAMMYCPECHMPGIEEKQIPVKIKKKPGRPRKNELKAPQKVKEITIKWCVFCEEPVKPKVLFKKDYISLVKNLSLIYRGIKKNI